MKLISYTGASTYFRENSEIDSELHLPGLDEHDSETLCGKSWSFEAHEEINGNAPTCHMCISVAQELFKRYSKKQVNSW